MKDICTPEQKNDYKKIVQKYDNTPIALIFCENLSFTGNNKPCKRIAKFYEKLFDSFFKWAERDFKDYAAKTYLSDSNPRKKFRYIPIELKYVLTAQKKQPYIFEVSLKITVSKKKKILSEKKLVHCWNLKTGTLSLFKNKKSR